MESLKDKLKNLRTDYNLAALEAALAEKNPFNLFSEWMELALKSNIEDANAMNLATVTETGRPSSRIVLLRKFDETGFDFFTNYNSRKAKELENNKKAAINFFWPLLHKQVRIEGIADKISREESDEYFNSRPRESQIGAWASDQSNELTNREELNQKIENLTKKFLDKPVPRPEGWGGIRISPDYYEFWQGRSNRLHDRLFFKLETGNKWKAGWLYP
jgi:pyridoxamine 5'-phosphate oxidase